MNIAFAVAPDIAEENKMAAVEKVELEWIDLTFERADTQIDQSGSDGKCSIVFWCSGGDGFR